MVEKREISLEAFSFDGAKDLAGKLASWLETTVSLKRLDPLWLVIVRIPDDASSLEARADLSEDDDVYPDDPAFRDACLEICSQIHEPITDEFGRSEWEIEQDFYDELQEEETYENFMADQRNHLPDSNEVVREVTDQGQYEHWLTLDRS